MGNKYIIYNGTDGITASPCTFTSKKKAQEVIEKLREGYRHQGYYRDNRWNKIAPEDIDYRIIRIDKSSSVLDTAVGLYSGRIK